MVRLLAGKCSCSEGEAVTDKKPTVGQLLRKIERLEARLAACEKYADRQFDVYRENLYEATDAQIKIAQAMRILNGDDEP